MPRIVNQLIGIVEKVSRAEGSTVVDFKGTVQIYDGTSRTAQNLKFVLTPAATAGDTALLAAGIGKQLELDGIFQQDDLPGTTTRANSIMDIIVG